MMTKGILRIAIEDFLNTSPIGKLIRGWFDTMFHKHEHDISVHAKELFQDLKSIPDVDNYLHLSAFESGDTSHQGGLLEGLGMMWGIGSQAGGSFISPLMTLGQYKANKKWKPARFNPQLAMSVLWRDPAQALGMVSEIADQGWSEQDIKNWAMLLGARVDEQTLIIQWLRGNLSEAEFTKELKARGWEDSSIVWMKDTAHIIPGVSDLISMAVRDAWNEDAVRRFQYDEGYPAEVGEWTAKQGLSAEWALRYWRAHWQLPSPTQAFEMFQRLRPGVSKTPFTEDDLFLLLKTADYPAYFRNRLMEIAYNTITRVDIRRLYAEGIYNEQDVLDKYLDGGYSPKDAKDLADYTIHSQTDSELGKKEKRRLLTLSTLINLFKKQVIDEVKLRSRLAELGYNTEDIEYEITIAKLDMVGTSAVDYRPEYNRDIKSITEAEYTARFIDKQGAQTLLASIGMLPEDIDKTLTVADYKANANRLNDALNAIQDGYINGQITYQTVVQLFGKLGLSGASQTQMLGDWDAIKDIRNKGLTEAQYRAAWVNGYIDETGYRNYMKLLKYSDDSIELLVKLYNPEAQA